MPTKMRFLPALAAISSLLLGACHSMGTIDAAHNSQNSLDWAGSYAGLGACATCFELITLEANGQYQWQSQQEGQAASQRQGLFTWDAQGQHIVISSEPTAQFFVGENHLRPQAKAMQKSHWRKVEVLQDPLGSMLIDAASMDRSDPAALRLSAVENWAAPRHVAARSLAADYVLNCFEGSYRMPKADYHQGLWGVGPRIHTAPAAADVRLSLAPEDSRMRLLFARYCPAISPPAAPAAEASHD